LRAAASGLGLVVGRHLEALTRRECVRERDSEVDASEDTEGSSAGDNPRSAGESESAMADVDRDRESGHTSDSAEECELQTDTPEMSLVGPDWGSARERTVQLMADAMWEAISPLMPKRIGDNPVRPAPPHSRQASAMMPGRDKLGKTDSTGK